MIDQAYIDTVRLLLRVVPDIFRNEIFAMKGETAINLFVQDIHDEYTASYQEQILEEEAELFPAAMLGELPPLHFIARLSGGRTLKGRIPILLTDG